MRRNVAALALLLWIPGTARAEPVIIYGTEDRSDFGRAVALSGNVLAVGAPGAHHESGAVYIYCFDGPTFRNLRLALTVEKFRGNHPVQPIHTGFAVALAGKRLAVSAEYFQGAWGAEVYLFELDAACPSVAWHRSMIGGFRTVFDLAFDGNLLAVADTNVMGPDRGGVFFYTFLDDWLTKPRLALTIGDGIKSHSHHQIDLPSDIAFGHFVDVRGSRIIIGADKFGPTEDKIRTGTAYAFECRRPSLRSCKLTHGPIVAELNTDDFFGASGKSEGDLLYVGAPGDDGLGGTVEGYGAVHILRLREGRATPIGRMGVGYTSNGDTDIHGLGVWDRFGYAVSVDGGRLAVGAPQRDTREPKPGKVYLFGRGK